MSENSKSNYVLFGNTVIDLAEVVHYQKDIGVSLGQTSVTLTFIFKSGYKTIQILRDEAIKDVPTIEQMFYKFWGLGYGK